MLKRIVAIAFAFLITAAAALAATPREKLLVSTDWLKQHVHDPNLVLLQVGDKESFEAGHIAGAHAITSLQDIHVTDRTMNGLILEMPSADELRKRLENAGISDDSRIIVYYGKDWVSPSTRILFTLEYAGLGARASMLDGGLDAWTHAGGEVTKDATPAKVGKLSLLKVKPELIVKADFVRSHIGKKGYAIVDGRTSVFYDGVEAGMDSDQSKQRLGHIKSAHSIPFTSITDDQLMVKSTDELRAMFEKAGVGPKDTVIGYCHIGMQTTAMLLAARILGHPVLLYDGSYQDWNRHADYPVEGQAAGQ